jgi:RHS repeat-associated protein
VAVVPGTNVFTIRATDPSGNAATATYEVDVTDAPKTFTYDANGNLTADGTRTFEWDARNQLVAVTVGTHRSEFVYNGLRRRVRQVEKDNGVTTADTRVLWCETAICEERAADGVTVTRRAFGIGEQVNGQARFFATDHLGSVREVTDTAGTLLARYAFDPWGRRTVTAGTDVTTVGFTGHRTHTSSGLALALYRGYDAALGRWVSEDPAGYVGGANLSAYVESNPLTRFDSDGLRATCCFDSAIILLSIPVYLNKKTTLSDWQLVDATSDPPTPANNGFPTIGSAYNCVWKRLVERSEKWLRFVQYNYRCTDSCGNKWTEIRFGTQYFERASVDWEQRPTRVFVPVIMDAVLDPMEVCRRKGRPGR